MWDDLSIAVVAGLGALTLAGVEGWTGDVVRRRGWWGGSEGCARDEGRWSGVGVLYLSTCWEMVEIPGDRTGSAPAASAVHRRTPRLRREARGMIALSAASHSPGNAIDLQHLGSVFASQDC